MGRGRAKAKQTKVARKLKYTTTGTDIQALQAELAGRPEDEVDSDGLEDDDDEGYDDPYAVGAEAEFESEYDDEDDEDDRVETPPSRRR